MSNRVITEQDRANAQRLKAIWARKKRELGLTQVQLAERLGYNSQSMISQLLNARVALNTDAVLRLAQVLKVAPGEIDPDLTSLTISPSKLRHVKAPVIARMSGEAPSPFETVEIATTMTRQVYGVSVDQDGFAPFAKKGSTLILSQEEEPVSGDEVFIRLHTDAGVLHLLKRYVMTDHASGFAVVRGLFDDATEELPLDRIEVMDPVVSVERPMVNRPVRLHPSRSAS